MLRDQLETTSSLVHIKVIVDWHLNPHKIVKSRVSGRCPDTLSYHQNGGASFVKLGQFRENGEFIDVRLKVDKSIFPAHRNVLAANSDYFHAMFTNGMKESNQEVIEFKDENLTALGFKVVMVPSTVENSLLTRKTYLKFLQLRTTFRWQS